MYKMISKNEWVKILNLPIDYKVDYILACGTYDKKREIERINTALQEIGVNYKFETIEDKFFSRVTPILIKGKRYWFDICYGGAYLSEMLHTGSMLGSRSNILLGSCGGLKKGIKALDIILPTYSYGNESSTRMYSRSLRSNKHYPDKKLTLKIKENINFDSKIYSGPIITCQAMLGETLGDIQKWSGEGYLGVEMESSTFFAVSNHFKVPSCAFLNVGDNLIEGDYVGSENYNLLKEKKERLQVEKYKVVFKTLIK